MDYITTEDFIKELEDGGYSVERFWDVLRIYIVSDGEELELAECSLNSLYSLNSRFFASSDEWQAKREEALEPIMELIIRYIKTPVEKREIQKEVWLFSFPLCHPFKDYLQPVKANSAAEATTALVKIYGLNWGDIYREKTIAQSETFKDSKRLPLIEVV